MCFDFAMRISHACVVQNEAELPKPTRGFTEKNACSLSV